MSVLNELELEGGPGIAQHVEAVVTDLVDSSGGVHLRS